MSEEPPLSRRMPLVMAAGLRNSQVAKTADALRQENPAGTVLVHHDLRQINQGVVRRLVRREDNVVVTVLELGHGCVSCTLREDLLPLLRRLGADPDIDRIVLQLDPALEPETICWAIQHVLVNDRPVIADVEIEAVVTAVDSPTWLGDVSGDESMAERGLGGSPDDERTVSEVGVAQVEFADALVLHGSLGDQWQSARTEAVISRLAPVAPMANAVGLVIGDLLARIPPGARRGECDGHDGPLLRGQPSFEVDAGVSLLFFEQRRPFHPQRLHDALDVLLDGVIRTRGRAWVASQPDVMLWLESAGGGLRVGHAGPWLAAISTEQASGLNPQRQLRATLNWDSFYGDRMQELVVIAHETSPHEITQALRGALLTEDELVAGEAEWLTYDDPFGEWHTDPCGQHDEAGDIAKTRRDGST